MNIALIGYGKMGKTIERIALQRGHKIVCKIDIENLQMFDSEEFKSADIAIEFTSSQVAEQNVRKCFERGKAVVCGTTGWTERLSVLKKEINERGYTLFWASNFSLGVNIFFALNAYLAKIMNNFPSYDVMLEEVHHVHKQDAPSGTAITLAENILQQIDRKKTWVHESAKNPDEIAIFSIREGEVSGIHSILYESGVDSIILTHEAKNRDGFALGAVVAAEFTLGKKGLFGMNDIMKF
ncbi:MAG: 4-hydroxy-tetrahydrodipicolinate reductase [Prevotellaceae bacterium]|jgi:4-hydroxy-tetrahydrodipicolinate reductase|nr:4-hydroxy-tetrahydrodipicolinate reductase [Prevotellaceae bacterium]